MSLAQLKDEAAHLRSEERRVGKGVDLGGRRIIKKKKKILRVGENGELRRQSGVRGKKQVQKPTNWKGVFPAASTFFNDDQRLDIEFFFFSSRRRHTRLTCDWSSDVCSSD